MSKIKLIVFVLILIGSTSCNIKKWKNEKYEAIELNKLYENVQQSNLKYNSLLIKFSTKYKNSGKSMGLKGTVKIKKDSVIIISLIALLGIEAAKLKFTNDSIFIIDRLNSVVKKGNYEYLKKTFSLDLSYNDLQSILTNYFFLYPNTDDNKSEFVNNFKFNNDTNNYSVYRKLPNSIENLMKIGKGSNKIVNYSILDIPQNRSLRINYKGIFSKLIYKMPKKLKIESNNLNKLTTIDLVFNKITIDKDLRFSFKIPNNYKLIVY